ncbi:hypothetical protein O3H73_29345, partial [Escherichia coli]|nr:hypothetical protein [Escherichia coli]MDA5292342.1 hypothetical protein [Escherichia coli]MDA5297874.1 hypothetical protein [Escherichia coli]
FHGRVADLQLPHQPQANFRLRSFLNHLRNHNDYSASSILSFALSSASYRADFLKLRFPKISVG